MSKRNAVIALLTEFTGQQNVLTIPRALIKVCQGDILAALLLSQILYWSDRTDDPDGWVAKSYEDWTEEIGLTEYQIKRAIKGDKRRKNGGFCLSDVGVETTLRQSKYYGNAPTMHYRVDTALLHDAIVSSLNLNNVKDASLTMSGKQSKQCSESYNKDTETTAKTTTENTKKDHPPTAGSTTSDNVPQEPDSATPEAVTLTPQQAMFQAVVDSQRWTVDTMTTSNKAAVGKVARELVSANANPAQIAEYWRWLQAKAKTEGWKSVTLHTMPKYWPDFAKTKRHYVAKVPVTMPDWARKSGVHDTDLEIGE